MGHLILFTNKTHYFLLQYGSVEYMKIKRTHYFLLQNYSTL